MDIHGAKTSMDETSMGESPMAAATNLDNQNTLCVKIVPPLTCYNLYIHGSIATIFGKNVAEKVGSQKIL